VTAVQISVGDVMLEGNLSVPARATSLIIFAHGSGSSRLSPRNRRVAQYFNERELGTLLLDLLTADEERIDMVTRELRFNIPMLARRVAGTADWALKDAATRGLPVGLFGASTGAAAALIAAAELGTRVAAVVSRGGRPDLAGPALPSVTAPTLLIVGGDDHEVLELNRFALSQMTCQARLVTVAGATHLFEEPGTLDQVARLAADWFEQHMRASPPGAPPRE
jgi:pimeloyl-ACP methyl ester carboxylesterase